MRGIPPPFRLPLPPPLLVVPAALPFQPDSVNQGGIAAGRKGVPSSKTRESRSILPPIQKGEFAYDNPESAVDDKKKRVRRVASEIKRHY